MLLLSASRSVARPCKVLKYSYLYPQVEANLSVLLATCVIILSFLKKKKTNITSLKKTEYTFTLSFLIDRVFVTQCIIS